MACEIHLQFLEDYWRSYIVENLMLYVSYVIYIRERRMRTKRETSQVIPVR